jgi:hypothetical protein
MSKKIFGQNPNVSKSRRLHVMIFRFFIFFEFEIYSITFSKMIGDFP